MEVMTNPAMVKEFGFKPHLENKVVKGNSEPTNRSCIPCGIKRRFE